MDYSHTGEAAVGIITTIAGYLKGRNKGCERSLEHCRKEHRETKDKLSAMETELVVLRKLLPGGEWYVKLGLDEHPSAFTNDKDKQE